MTKMKEKMSLESVQELDTEDRIRVLGIIDQLRELGVNEDVSLPQLVVVGDQSSGKSSLLEGLTGVKFPIASELCTRFATQIVLRRSSSRSAKVSIIPGLTADDDSERKVRLLAFSRDLSNNELTTAVFTAILDEAAIAMGLPVSSETDFANLGRRFSDDILKIELSGPMHNNLSVVDVPGLFHNPTKFQTQEDLDVIRSLLQKYVSDRRTIILAVMDARNNLANQEVFRMARAADPEGRRTVGIITKCDAVQDGDEPGVLNIAMNRVEQLAHGWFAVRNRTTQEISSGVDMKQRDANEKKFFSTAPWNALPKERTGIASLKKFLATLLYEHIRSEFPALVQDLRNLIAESRSILEGLGASRQTTVQQRQFLSRLAERYQARVTGSLRGAYEPHWSSEDVRKLRMLLHQQNEAFAVSMRKDGHLYAFEKADSDDDPYISTTSTTIMEWIRTSYRQSRGAELHGTINPLVLEMLFRQQGSPWSTIARKHLEAVDALISDFNRAIWSDLAVETTVKDKMQALSNHATRETRSEAKIQLEKLLKDEFEGILQTVNHYYADNITKARIERLRCRFEAVGISENHHYMPGLEELLSAAQLSNEDQAVQDVHDTLKAYYKVALKRFSDNVVIQCIERCYIGEEGPVRVISPALVGGLTDNELHDIAAEDYSTAVRRTETEHRLKRLEAALKLAEAEGI